MISRIFRSVFSDSIAEDATAADILFLFLREQKKELLRRNDTLTQAIYEFYLPLPRKPSFSPHRYV